MSILHFVHAAKRIQTILVIHHLGIKQDSLKAEARGEDDYFLYIYGESARGIDLTLENNVLEIRTTTLASNADYELANEVAKVTLNLFGGVIYNEEEELLQSNILFDEERINTIQAYDANTLKSLCALEKSISIYGPMRQVHFGYNMFKVLEVFNNAALYEKMYKVIHAVQYELPDFNTGGVLKTGEGEDAKFIKVLASGFDYIIDKYDYLILDRKIEGNMLMITNEILNTILPNSWKLMDEYTILAPALNENEWLELIEKATPLNQFDSFSNR
jgi:hypothetical protein